MKCGYCGKVHEDLIDVVYPLNRKGTKWNVYCNSSEGGCGRIVYGSTREEAIERWNNYAHDDSDKDL